MESLMIPVHLHLENGVHLKGFARGGGSRGSLQHRGDERGREG